MRGLRFTRDDMKGSGLIHGQSVYPVSYSLLTALALLALGLFAVVSMVLRAGPLG
jgi:putative membrane protein